MVSVARLYVVSLFLLACQLGCGVRPDEKPHVKGEALGQQCAAANPTATFTHGISVTSPSSYTTTNCTAAVVYDVSSYDGNIGSAPDVVSTTVGINVSGLTATACQQNNWVNSDLFVRVGASWQYVASQQAFGVQATGGVTSCRASIVWAQNQMPNGGTYRVTASAGKGDPNGFSSRQAVTVQTRVDGFPDACLSGQVLSDGNPCTADSCNGSNGAVTHALQPAGSSCSDGNLCNGAETCDSAGTCIAGTPTPVDDGNICTADSCTPSTGLPTHTPTPGVQCSSGSCTAAVQTLPGLCTSTGTCAPGTTISCGNYACSGISCLAACTTDSQCSTGNFCSASNCAPKLGPNQSCTASNACLAGTCVDGGCCDVSSAVDPLAGVAIKTNVPTDFVTQIRPLYNATPPTQVLGSGGIDETRVAVIRGKVLNETGAPGIPCAKVSVVGQAGAGSTRTRADGSYTIAVNGGGPVVLRVELGGYLSVDRQVDTKWHAYAIAQDVHLLQFGAATVIPVDSSGAVLAATGASGASETDAQGTRTASLIVPAGTKATVEGQSSPLTNLNIQIKEMTNLSKTGRDGMIASLPYNSAFTYAVSLSVTGAENKTVNFTQPVPVYVNNFLAMPNGTTVPVGYYDPKTAQWVASENGRVIKIVGKDLTSGEAQLDLDGTAGAESTTSPDMIALGITSAERLKLASAPYTIGMSLWRFRTTHFSSWDANWGWGPPGPPPNNPPPTPPLPPCGGSTASGSIIDCEKQGLREKLPIAGTPFEMFYASNRQPGGIKPLHIPLTASTLPAGLKSVRLEIYVAGRKIAPTPPSFATPTVRMSYDFYWDGLDAAGRKLYGAQPITTRVGFSFSGNYLNTPNFGAAPTSTVVASSNDRFDNTLWQEWSGVIDRWDAQQSGLGGWDIDVHHGYDPLSGTLHLGDGRDELVPSTLMAFASIHPPRPFSDDGLTVDADGSLYFVDNSGTTAIKKLAIDGTTTTIAGGSAGTATTFPWGDGGLASAATIHRPSCLAAGPNHKLYVCETTGDESTGRVRVIDLGSGIINVFAGGGRGTEPGPALTVKMTVPAGIAFAADGTAYIAEQGLAKLFRVRDGQITNADPVGGSDPIVAVAVGKDGSVYYARTQFLNNIWKLDVSGNVTEVTRIRDSGCPASDTGPAATTCLTKPISLAIGTDGLLYISDAGGYKVKRINATGNIETVLGTGVAGNGIDGLSGPDTAIGSPGTIAIAPDGTLYVVDGNNGISPEIRFSRRSIAQGFPAIIPSSDGRELYAFGSDGHHSKTLDAHTGILKYAFKYDDAGYLTGISDREFSDTAGHVTSIKRDTSETPMSIDAPFGQSTSLSVVSNQLKTVTDPENGVYAFDYYSSSGLLQHFSDPVLHAASGTPYEFTFTNDLLTKDADPLGNSQSLTQSPIANGWRVTRNDQLLRATTYDTQSPDPLTVLSTITGPDLLSKTNMIFLDGRRADLGPDSKLYSGHQHSPDGSSIYSLSDSDPILGVRAPVASSSVEFMGSSSDPHRATVRSRNTVLGSPTDLTSIQSYTESQTVNGRTQSDKIFYDASMRKFTTTSSAGRQTYRVVDSHGRTTSLQIGTLTPTQFAYDDTTTLTGKVSTEERNDGTIDLKKTYTYYGAGNGKMSGYLHGISYALNGVLRQSSSYSTDAYGRTVLDTTGADMANFGFDGNGNLTSVTPPNRPEHDLSYTFFNQISKYTPPALPATTPPTPVATSYHYNADRTLDTVTTPDNVITSRTYDPSKARLTDIATPAGTSHYDYYGATETAAGQAPGRIKTISSPYGANLAFNYLGRLTTKTTWSGSVAGSVAWTYDNDFARISETITDAAGASAAIQFGYTDSDKFLTCASLGSCTPPGSDALTITHDSVNGLLSGVNFGASFTETYGYDKFGQLASKNAKLGTTPILLNVFDPVTGTANRRDALGRITHREETVGTTVTKFDYSYSPEGRLTDVLVNGSPSEHYDYIANGNRAAAITPQRTVAAGSVHYDDGANHLSGQDLLTAYGQFSYKYTNNGELKSKTDTSTSTVTTYVYDALGNLVTVSPSTGLAITYVIDGMNRRVAKKRGTSVIKQWLYRDGLKPVAELDGSGHLLSTYVYGSNRNVPDYMVTGGKTYRILTDQLGSVRMVVDVSDSTHVPFSATYTAFGEATITGTPDFLPFGFAGGMLDIDTGLVRFGMRDYDPVIGRWTQKDPIRFKGGQANIYVYLNNDPLNGVDPLGLGGSWGDFARIVGGYIAGKIPGAEEAKLIKDLLVVAPKPTGLCAVWGGLALVTISMFQGEPGPVPPDPHGICNVPPPDLPPCDDGPKQSQPPSDCANMSSEGCSPLWLAQ